MRTSSRQTAKLKDALHGTLKYGCSVIRKASQSSEHSSSSAKAAANGLKLDYLLNGLYFQTLGSSLIDLVSVVTAPTYARSGVDKYKDRGRRYTHTR